MASTKSSSVSVTRSVSALHVYKTVKRIFLQFSGGGKYRGNLDYEVLANALSQATHMHIDQNEVDDAMLYILNDADSTIAETNSIKNLPQIEVPKFVSMTEFLILMQHFERKYNKVEDSDEDDEDSIHERPSLLRENSNHLFPHRKILCPQDDGKDADLVRTAKSTHDNDFISLFPPTQMKYLALVSHNGMKSTMKRFVLANKNVLKKFCLTGTNSTMTMLKEVIGKRDPDVVYGPSCSSGPLGGDAELAALMTQGKMGGIIFFTDPMSAHPHQADIDGLCRLAMVHNTMILQNPTTAVMMMDVLRNALRESRPEMIPSFFFDLVSPSVSAYKEAQRLMILETIADDDVTVASAAVRRRSLQILNLDVTFKDFVDSDEESLIDSDEESLILVDNSLRELRIQNHSNGIDLSRNKSKNSMPPANVFVLLARPQLYLRNRQW